MSKYNASTRQLNGTTNPMPRPHSRITTKTAIRKIDFDGAYLMRFDASVDWKDRNSSYAASFAELLDGSLIYIAERISNKWYYGLWNPLWNWNFTSLGACRKAIQDDFKSHMNDDAERKKESPKRLYFPNMQWSRNYAYRRLEFDGDFLEIDRTNSFDQAIKITYDLGNYIHNHSLDRTRRMLKGLDYTVWFVYAKLDGYERITYVIERIGKKWVGARWDGAQWFAGTTLRECQGAIWTHMTKWYRSNDLKRRVERYQSHMN